MSNSIFQGMKEHEFAIMCPHCGRSNDRASEVTGVDNPPHAEREDGIVCILICFDCANTFALDLHEKPRFCTPQEMQEMLEDNRILKAIGLVHLMQQIKRTKEKARSDKHAVDRDETSRAGK